MREIRRTCDKQEIITRSFWMMLAVWLTACSELARDTQATQVPQAKVALDAFSGRQAPTWTLSRANTSTFLHILEGLPAATSRAFQDNLGYRGFLVSVNGVDSGSLDIKVFNGLIRHTAGETVRYVTDADRRLERWLLTTGKLHLAPDLYEAIEKELGPAPEH